jgi:hypothetical protein
MLQMIINFVFRCRHRHLTCPFTTRGGGDTYVACLDCGTRLAYDLKEMRLGRPIDAFADPELCRKGALSTQHRHAN